jgi:ATP-binding cassette subfamily B protein
MDSEELTKPASREQNQKGRGYNTSWRVMWRLLGQSKCEYISLVLSSSLLSGIEGVLHPLLVRSIFDEIVSKRNLHQLIIFILYYLALGLFLNVVGGSTSCWGKSIESRIVRTVNQQLLGSYYDKEYASVLERGSGYFISRIHGDVRDGLTSMLSLIQTTVSIKLYCWLLYRWFSCICQ